MRARCENPDHPNYDRYGGRGIEVCTRWSSFENFLEDMGPACQPGLTLDRMDNGRSYCPGNCRWVTQREQNRNQERTKLSAEMVLDIKGRLLRGERQVDLAREYGVAKQTIGNIRMGRTYPDVGQELQRDIASSRAHTRLTPLRRAEIETLYAQGVGKSEIARRMGRRPSVITYVLRDAA
jgi:DNA-binding XRE family transcriptional regulator